MKPSCLNLALISAAIAGGSSTTAFARQQLSKLSESGKPLNVVFILSDDHRYDYMGFCWQSTLAGNAGDGQDGPRRSLDQKCICNHLAFFSQPGLHSDGDVFAQP